MKFNCVQNKLHKALGKTNAIVSKNIDLPVLSCVLVTGVNDQVLLQTTDIEHALTITIPAKVESEGTTAIPSDVFTRLISSTNIQDDTLKFNLEEAKALITNSQSNTNISTLDHTEFPAIPHIETDSDTRQFELSISDFITGLQTVSFAASHSNIKPELSSVFINYEAGHLYFVCTDGFRLIEKVFRVDLGADDFSLLLPVKSALIISKIFDGVDENTIDFFVNDNQLAIQAGNIYFTCRLVSGSFPDYKRLIPTDKETSAVVLKEDLSQVLKLSNIFSNEFHEVLLNIDPKQKLCEITSSNQTVGMNQTNIPAALEGDAVSVKFNYRYVTECLPSISTDSLELSFTAPGRPIKINTVPDSKLTYIVMPLNK